MPAYRTLLQGSMLRKILKLCLIKSTLKQHWEEVQSSDKSHRPPEMLGLETNLVHADNKKIILDLFLFQLKK